MKRRVFYLGVLLATFLMLVIGIQGSNADNGDGTGRFKTVEIRVTQYIWELVSNVDGRMICQVIVEHPNQPTNTEAIQICGDQIFPPEETPTPIGATAATPTPGGSPAPTPTPFDLADFFRSVSWRFITSREFSREVQVPVPEMVTNISIPQGQQGAALYVILTAYEPVYGERITSISGTLNGLSFTCPSNRCHVPITTDSSLVFWATSSVGDESRRVEATLRVNRVDNANRLVIESLVPITYFQDSCANIWGATLADLPAWAGFPNSPADLNTMKPYQYLAGQLLSAGLVDASDCPGGGLWAGGGPNSCGLERAAGKVIAWQNQYDTSIWEAGRSVGIPPTLIKALIEQESQFWPGNSRIALYEFGLGQLSQAGLDVALRWDNDLFASACNGLLYDCSKVYGRMTSWEQATVRGGLLTSLDAECPTCSNGIDMAAAYDSIPVFARTLRANCRQVQYLMDTREIADATYEDMWKFTFLSYHSGYNCLADALVFAEYNLLDINWENVSGFLSCESGRVYVDNVWKALDEFDTYRVKTSEPAQPETVATFAPTPAVPTPTLTPTPVLAMSKLRVMVYVDINSNSYPDAGERTDGVRVVLTFPDGSSQTASTVNGEALFSLAGRVVGEDLLVSLPELYRTEKVRVIRDGEIPVVFRLEQPVVPPALP